MDHEFLSILYESILLQIPTEDCILILKIQAPKNNLIDIQRYNFIDYLINIPVNDGKLEVTLMGNFQLDILLNPVERVRMWMRLGQQS